ncbi:GNAT family N-acetyltransferase [Streptomyces sp. ME19-01-6]|uniref:GNAT family N-acetyltransferase n=1 Tax=Streptomyces sp. ME19-01-6 TaxID=3028686 RepID=UPI0029A5D0F0|nr:GNAT family N-acetyltransferase [Streptomyces sp. ME19-01-6]MDX3228843.1 GNAT family N-acetyltransferase [Streptomyces sp. ME19-01-6]
MDGVRVRDMTEADIDAVAAVRVRGWQAAYRGLVPQAHLDGLSVEKDAERRREFFSRGVGDVVNLVVENAFGEVVGWACFGPYRDRDLPSGDAELYAIYVRPDLIGTGVGHALLTESVSRTTERGFPRLRLWVLKDNAHARHFYERAGFTPDGGQEDYEVDGVPVPEVRYARALAPMTV